MGDLISRQAAIAVLHMDTSIIPYKKAREYADITILEVRNRIEQLPSAQPEQSFGEWKQDFTGYVEMLNMPKDDFKGIMEYINEAPFTQPETCEGCKHLGKWENEVEYGYPSPCTRCKRRVEDHYER